MTPAPSVLLAGLGNIGSYSALLFARQVGLASLTLVDFDRYESGNLASQAAEPSDVGRPKAEVQAARLRRLRDGLDVRELKSDVEDLPLGAFRSTIVASALDGRRARRRVAEAAHRLGAGFLDAGVEPTRGLARLTWIDPSDTEGPCYECSWSAGDYETEGSRFGCDGSLQARTTPPTGSTAALGSLAASLQAVELQSRLAKGAESRPSYQAIFESTAMRSRRWGLERNPLCRFHHARPAIEPLDLNASAAWGELFGALGKRMDGSDWRFGVWGRRPLMQGVCRACEQRFPWLRLDRELGALACPRCLAVGEVSGVAGPARASIEKLWRIVAERTTDLASAGFQNGDVVEVEAGDRLRCFEIAGGGR